MSRSSLPRTLAALLVVSAAACAGPTAPAAPAGTRTLSAPGTGASFDDITPPPTDSTCRSGYMSGQGYTC